MRSSHLLRLSSYHHHCSQASHSHRSALLIDYIPRNDNTALLVERNAALAVCRTRFTIRWDIVDGVRAQQYRQHSPICSLRHIRVRVILSTNTSSLSITSKHQTGSGKQTRTRRSGARGCIRPERRLHLRRFVGARRFKLGRPAVTPFVEKGAPEKEVLERHETPTRRDGATFGILCVISAYTLRRIQWFTQQLLRMLRLMPLHLRQRKWRNVSAPSQRLKFDGLSDAGDWVTVVDKVGAEYLVVVTAKIPREHEDCGEDADEEVSPDRDFRVALTSSRFSIHLRLIRNLRLPAKPHNLLITNHIARHFRQTLWEYLCICINATPTTPPLMGDVGPVSLPPPPLHNLLFHLIDVASTSPQNNYSSTTCLLPLSSTTARRRPHHSRSPPPTFSTSRPTSLTLIRRPLSLSLTRRHPALPTPPLPGIAAADSPLTTTRRRCTPNLSPRIYARLVSHLNNLQAAAVDCIVPSVTTAIPRLQPSPSAQPTKPANLIELTLPPPLRPRPHHLRPWPLLTSPPRRLRLRARPHDFRLSRLRRRRSARCIHIDVKRFRCRVGWHGSPSPITLAPLPPYPKLTDAARNIPSMDYLRPRLAPPPSPRSSQLLPSQTPLHLKSFDDPSTAHLPILLIACTFGSQPPPRNRRDMSSRLLLCRRHSTPRTPIPNSSKNLRFNSAPPSRPRQAYRHVIPNLAPRLCNPERRASQAQGWYPSDRNFL
ncbi:hypothetical protein R3P38DRAFT_3497585 [Favolaschia claudopus]|uniref:Uncharacterized protein n=1 Tax=Favolaschia claudopus TaxID=2862362 RepID=A0AAV9Z619_9AGAR